MKGMTRYQVLRCPRCSRAKSVLATVKSARCSYCSNRFKITGLKKFYQTDNVSEAAEIVGRLNSELAGKTDEFIAEMTDKRFRDLEKKVPSAFDTSYQYVGYRLGEFTGEKRTMEAVMRLLTEELGHFTADDVIKALAEADRSSEKVDEYIDRMIQDNLIFSKDGKHYRYIS